MDIHVAIQVVDEKDRKHLATTLRLANVRDSTVQWVECPLDEADVVILRRGERDTVDLLRTARGAGRPIVVVYTMNKTDQHPWVLRWPARTTDLAALAGSLATPLKSLPPRAATQQPAAPRSAVAAKPH
ncbi:MAG: hypothetical protein ACLGHG_09430 [Gammaproteobacteria bacterium]